MIPESWIADLKARVDLVALGRSHGLVWTKEGSDAPQACCPFHDEKTPSFAAHLRPKSGGPPIYHCYGACGRSWDAIEFHRQQTGDGFVESLEALAATVGMAVPTRPESETDRAARQAQNERRRAGARALELAQGWLARALRADAAEAARARDYLQDRGFPAGDSEEPFGFGLAPADGWLLLRWLQRQQRVGDDALMAAGLLSPAEGDRPSRPRFWGRVTLPIRDRRGAVVSFAGRVVGDGRPKYMNGPDTELFDKGATLYGLDLAAAEIRRRGRALVVEGHFDRVACHLAGLTHCVAMQGTAFTDAHAQVLRALAPVVVFAVDGDTAGDRALARALPVCLEAGLVPRVVELPRGADPDDVLRLAA